MNVEPDISDSGMELRDLLQDTDFCSRRRRQDATQNAAALRRLAHVFAEKPEMLLQELVDLTVHCCSADSAGISLEEVNETGDRVFRWIAISGSFAQYTNATTPRFFSPCGVCLDSGRPQLYRVRKPYYDFLGVTADEIKDGMLIPWINEHVRGTIWAVAHHREQAFDLEDYELLNSLADFASTAIRHQYHQQSLRERDKGAAVAAKINELAHLINNPLQSLTNTLYLARESGVDAHVYVEQAWQELSVLSKLVGKILSLGDH